MKTTMILIFLFISLRAACPPDNAMLMKEAVPIRSFDPMLYAFEYVESNFDTDTINALGYGGILQIGQSMINEVNRICQLNDYPGRFVLDDRLDRRRAEQIWYIIQTHHNPEYDLKQACKVWNPLASENYYNKIKRKYIRL